MQLLILLVAAILEAGGDALVRHGLHKTGFPRVAFFVLGTAVLFAYGYTVNAPSWNFGRLLGIYVVFFFLAAQAIAWFAFHERPTAPILMGGALIVAGGLVLHFGY